MLEKSLVLNQIFEIVQLIFCNFYIFSGLLNPRKMFLAIGLYVYVFVGVCLCIMRLLLA